MTEIDQRDCEWGLSDTTAALKDREQICREFHEACGGHWHEWKLNSYILMCKCGEVYTDFNENPSYENPIDVLRVMMNRKDWNKFACTFFTPNFYLLEYFVHLSYLTEIDKLLITSYNWIKKENL